MENTFNRIIAATESNDGVPIVRGTHIKADYVVTLLQSGLKHDAIIEMHPELDPDDIKACHHYGLEIMNRQSMTKPVYCRLDVNRKR
jgi:uncharacterized protein (DUF433 family)